MKDEMIAVRKLKPAPGLEVTTTKIPKIGDNDLLVKVKACSICGSDVHIYNWEHPWSDGRVKPPRTLGHEFAGEVVKIGKDVTSVEVGDYISAESHIVCGKCVYCKTGKSQVCEKTKILGIDTDGAFAEYVCVPEYNAWKNPKNMPPEVATLQEPMGNSVYVVYSADVLGKIVTIFGCGPTGLFATGLACYAGASKIIAIDRKKFRLDLAKKMGADVTINTEEQNVVEEIMNETDRSGADVFLEMAGNSDAIRDGIKTLKTGGKLVALGLPPEPIKLDWSLDVVEKMINIQGIYGREMFKTWYIMSNILSSGRLDITPIITHKFRLDEFDKAIEIAKSGKAGKIVLFPNHKD